MNARIPCDFAGNPDRENRVATVFGNSYATVDKEHVEKLVSEVASTIGNCIGCTLCLHVFMPPYMNLADAPPGYMQFYIKRPGLPSLLFAAEFVGKDYDRTGFSELTLQGMAEAAENGDPYDSVASVANFDELWLFACNVAERLQVSKIELSYGI